MLLLTHLLLTSQTSLKPVYLFIDTFVQGSIPCKQAASVAGSSAVAVTANASAPVNGNGSGSAQTFNITAPAEGKDTNADIKVFTQIVYVGKGCIPI